MSDLISRQSVINAIANTCFWLSADNWEELTKCINSIPSVLNDRPTGGDLISREEAKAQVKACYRVAECMEELGNLYEEVIDSIPSTEITDYAKAIREYCEKKRVNCANCPFYNRDRLLSCNLGDPCMSWDLPKGDDE